MHESIRPYLRIILSKNRNENPTYFSRLVKVFSTYTLLNVIDYDVFILK